MSSARGGGPLTPALGCQKDPAPYFSPARQPPHLGAQARGAGEGLGPTPSELALVAYV